MASEELCPRLLIQHCIKNRVPIIIYSIDIRALLEEVVETTLI